MSILTPDVLAHIEKIVARSKPFGPRQLTVISAALQPGLAPAKAA